MMGEKGSCHCGAVSYDILEGTQPLRHAMCHCTDCRRISGAPAVCWLLIPRHAVVVKGNISTYSSSSGTARSFCGECGTGLFYENAEIFPDQIDIQSATLDNPDAFSLREQVQTAERLGYIHHLDRIPAYDRYPEANRGYNDPETDSKPS